MEDFTQIAESLQKAQAKIQTIQQGLTQLRATGEAGAGAVKATVDGNKLILKLDIAQEYIRPDEKKMLQDLIIAAINLAHKAVEKKIQQEVMSGKF